MSQKELSDSDKAEWLKTYAKKFGCEDVLEAYSREQNKTAPAPELSEAQARKAEPVWSGVLNYFPRAIRAISRVSKAGNDKHNPGQPLHWAHDKSYDQPDAAARHMITPYDVDPDTGEMHLAHAAWRVLAWLEMVLWAEENDVPLGDFGVIGKEMAAEREEL